MFILLRFRSDGLFGRFPRGKMCFGKCMFFTSFLFFITFLVGTLFLEPDFHGLRFFAFSIRWFVWEVSKMKIVIWKVHIFHIVLVVL